MELLLALAERVGLAEQLSAMLNGEPVNTTERRPALHAALRAAGAGLGDGRADNGETPHTAPGVSGGGGVELVQQAAAELERMAEFVGSLRSGERLGSTDRPIRTVVNVGIGGSYLGPFMAYEALAAFRHPRLRCRFAAGADPAALAMALDGLNPAETLFVVTSKSFTTTETLTNARAARDWVAAELGCDAVSRHLAAVTAAPDAVAALGVESNATFAVWDWVGGRYSLASAVGLPVAAAVGFDGFSRMLAGMQEVDDHLASRPLHANVPVLMGMLAVWNRNFWGLPSRAVLPYSQRLRWFPAYLQQLEMESNGKRVRRDGQAVGYDTAPVVWGGHGTDGQHSFHQMLHQGTVAVPADFIVFASPDPDLLPLEGSAHRHDMLVANCLAQAAALAFGTDDVSLGPHRELPGNRPSTLITAPQLTPRTLGQLVALYEHQTVVQGAVWGINSFDQFGVEHGKRLAGSVLQTLSRAGSSPDAPNAALGTSSPSDMTTRASANGSGHDPATFAALHCIASMRTSGSVTPPSPTKPSGSVTPPSPTKPPSPIKPSGRN